MNIEQFTNTFTALAMLYGKEYTQEQVKIFYSVLKDLDVKDFKNACGELAKTNRFMPNAADIREKVKELQATQKVDNFWNTIEKMKEDRYFKSEDELDKIVRWYEKGIIPDWLRIKMEEYGLPKSIGKEESQLLLN